MEARTVRTSALLVATVAAFVGIITVAHYIYRRRRVQPDAAATRKLYHRTFSQIAAAGNVLRCYSLTSDEEMLFNTFSEVSSAIRDAGLVECKLIIGEFRNTETGGGTGEGGVQVGNYGFRVQTYTGLSG